MNSKSIWNRFSNLLNPTVTEASLRSLESPEGSWCILFYKPKETNAFCYSDSPTVRGKEFGDTVYNFFFLTVCGKLRKMVDVG